MDLLQEQSAQLEQGTLELDESNNATRFEIHRAEMGLEAARNEGKWLKVELDCLRRKAPKLHFCHVSAHLVCSACVITSKPSVQAAHSHLPASMTTC